MKNKNWLSPLPKNCDICSEELGKYFIDGKTFTGPWGIMCVSCHDKIGDGLGIGHGQKYLTKSGKGVDGFNE
jgi:hypothetical protein